jgi:hypothetical protein
LQIYLLSQVACMDSPTVLAVIGLMARFFVPDKILGLK